VNKALFLDLDGTIRKTKSGKPAPSHPDDQIVLPGRKEVLQHYKRKGYKIIAVTNQGGVASGKLTHADVKACLADLDHKLGYVFDDMHYCAAPSTSDHSHRKPNPGMILDAAAKHQIDLPSSLMVGDYHTDEEAAKRAGVPYLDANDFFRVGKGES